MESKIKIPVFLVLAFFSVCFFDISDPDINFTQYAIADNNQNSKVTDKSEPHTIILAGDGGRMVKEMSNALNETFSKSSINRSVVYLGDNIYTKGMPDKSNLADYQRAKKILKFQIEPALKTKTDMYFVAGNHDWDDEGSDGWNAVIRQQDEIRQISGGDHMTPSNACPGPQRIILSDNLQLIAFDTQWWLHKKTKPTKKEDGCDAGTKDEIKEKFKMISNSTGDGVISIFATHHPLKSLGQNGLGSRCTTDGNCPAYLQMVKELSEMLKDFSNLICVGGHDHGLQIITAGKNEVCDYYLVTGALSDTTIIKDNSELIFASSKRGYLKLDESADGRMLLIAITVDPAKRLYTPEVALTLPLKF